MLQTFAVSHYRSLRDLKLHLLPLTVVTGANGCGKSNRYRALRLLQRAAEGSLAQALAMEGGIESVCWAGPENPSSLARRGFTTQGGPRRSPLRVAFGFASDDCAYEISLGRRASSNPVIGGSFFGSDPEVKSEYLWEKPPRRKANTWLAREGDRVSLREQDGSWTRLDYAPSRSRSLLSELGEPARFPELLAMRERLRRWRFYDGFRTDVDSPLRQSRLGVQTDVLAGDGGDLAAALQTIVEIGDVDALNTAIDAALPGTALAIRRAEGLRLEVGLHVDGLLREMTAMELSDGTLRYLALLAALLTPRPPELLVLNEPEQSLHPDLLRPLARQIVSASKRMQVWIISHAPQLTAAVEDLSGAAALELVREDGETRVRGQRLVDEPVWP